MLFYNIGVFLYTLFIHISAIFNPKAKLWKDGRRDWKKKLSEKINALGNNERIWIHCASLGEFEQGRPVIEAIKQQFPQYKIILTFFSPSGYEARKNYEFADLVCYLPPDFKNNAEQFIKISNPKTVIFVKYEFWLNYLFELSHKQIPTYLISAVFKPHQPFFKWYGAPFVKALKTYKTIFLQDQHSKELLGKLQVNTGVVCGDTRIDRVIKINSEGRIVSELEKFSESSFTIIAGSSWPKDETILLESFKNLCSKYPKLKLVIAPHEIDAKHIAYIESELNKNNLSYTLFSKKENSSNQNVYLLDTIGLLSSSYKYGKLAYIGGGFDNGIHNTLEPAVYGLPVIFGPNNKKFNEAQDLKSSGGGFEINSKEQLEGVLNDLISNENLRQKAAIACLNYINVSKGASEKIINQVFNTSK